MSIYKQIMMELNKVYMPSQALTKCNNLIKLKYKTEDTEVKSYIDVIVQNLEIVHRLYDSKLYLKASGKLQETKRVENKLKNYCEGITTQGKPEWMVLAEKNGWKPPIG